ncbi:FAD/NAD(P)-binding protein [Sphingobium sp. Ant17]|uniref:FAD/NAD(P)-binding protein n=1 Tax=Sphingobium sp. Ant17 TaxID=1461752 RepID=UPI000449E8A3|nr:NAD(P)/FAD-dependent oxidoreductase [Sphingobium sp. Ant17]EXS71211.1 oxidoreductase [Sphingobium sp. Ant17]
MTLKKLERQVNWDLAALCYGGATWVRPRRSEDGHVHDVVIVGGGQSGLGAAFGLLRERVDNILVLDENPAGQEGPWETYARMITLRTPKHITSIDLGLPSLTFRAWYETQHGAEGWAALDKIPRGVWMDYLRWYRRVLKLPVENNTRLERIGRTGTGLYSLVTNHRTYLARKVILATGIQGGGNWHVPNMIEKALSPDLYAHTSGPVDFSRLVGKRIGILGAGASAFDNAQYGLKEGVAETHVYMRRSVFQRVNPIRHMEATGITGRYVGLSDADKYRFMLSFFARNQPPTNDTFDRAMALPGFHLHVGAPWLGVEQTADDKVIVTTPQGVEEFDFILLSTGLVTDPALRPELSAFAGDILRWRDCYNAPNDLRNAVIDDHPYLGPGFQYLGRTPEATEKLSGIFAFNYSGLVSLGLSASALSGLKYALPRLVDGVARDLFEEDALSLLAEHLAYDEEEFTGAREIAL